VVGLYCNWSTTVVGFGSWLGGIRAVGEGKQKPYELLRPIYGPNRRFVTAPRKVRACRRGPSLALVGKKHSTGVPPVSRCEAGADIARRSEANKAGPRESGECIRECTLEQTLATGPQLSAHATAGGFVRRETGRWGQVVRAITRVLRRGELGRVGGSGP
jgi:hypothetical protein